MGLQKKISQKAQERRLVRQEGFDRDTYLGKAAAERLRRAEETDNLYALFCPECRCLLKLSKFDGQKNPVRISVPDTEWEDALFAMRVRNNIIKWKMEDLAAGKPLTGQYSQWKKKACKQIFGGYNKSNAKEVDRLVERVGAYADSEGYPQIRKQLLNDPQFRESLSNFDFQEWLNADPEDEISPEQLFENAKSEIDDDE